MKPVTPSVPRTRMGLLILVVASAPFLGSSPASGQNEVIGWSSPMFNSAWNNGKGVVS